MPRAMHMARSASTKAAVEYDKLFDEAMICTKKKAAGLAEMGCLISSLVSHDHYPCIKIAICVYPCLLCTPFSETPT